MMSKIFRMIFINNIILVNNEIMYLVDPKPESPFLMSDFKKILGEFQDKVYNQAYRMMGNSEDAEEVTQDIFLKVFKNISAFRGECKMSTWIYRITSNECISRLRKKQLDMTSLDSPFDDGRTLSDVLPSDNHDTLKNMESEETAKYIRSQVNRLPAEWAMAICLYHFDDLSYNEISEIMSLPTGTIATYILRGRKQLAKWLVNVL
jgi:RNA polymerase sigma-70 factor, ECF subfamily